MQLIFAICIFRWSRLPKFSLLNKIRWYIRYLLLVFPVHFPVLNFCGRINGTNLIELNGFHVRREFMVAVYYYWCLFNTPNDFRAQTNFNHKLSVAILLLNVAFMSFSVLLRWAAAHCTLFARHWRAKLDEEETANRWRRNSMTAWTKRRLP